MAELHDVLIRPILTEKTTQLESAGNVYAFEVGEGANKHQIKHAVEELFEVRVTNVRTVRPPRKKRRVGKYLGQKPEWKKAIVTLAEGQSIEFFEGV